MGSSMPAWLNSRKQKNAGHRSKSGQSHQNGEYFIKTEDNGQGIYTHTHLHGYANINEGYISMTTAAHVHGCTTYMSILTSAYGPVVTPAYIAVSHSETTDALWALQFITFVAGEMHRGSSPAVRLYTEKNTLASQTCPVKKKHLSAVGVHMGWEYQEKMFTAGEKIYILSKTLRVWYPKVLHGGRRMLPICLCYSWPLIETIALTGMKLCNPTGNTAIPQRQPISVQWLKW